MKKIYSLVAFLLGAMFMVACGDDPTPTPTPEPEPEPGVEYVKPTISIQQTDVTSESFTFEVTSDVPGDYAYFCANVYDNTPRPNMPEWFNENSGKVDGKASVTIENLAAGVKYELFVVVRSTDGGLYSDVAKMEFTTKNSANAGPISLISAQHDRFVFKVNLSGYYRYFALPKTTLQSFGQTPETWVETAPVSSGVQDYEYISGEKGPDGNIIMVMPGATHVIGVQECDRSGNVYGECYTLEFDAPEAPASEALVKITLSNITSTSVDVKCEPDASVAHYNILIQPKATIDGIVENPSYGLPTLIALMDTGAAWSKSGEFSGTWTGLIPDTEYYVCLKVVDNQNNQNFNYDMTFTSGTGSGVKAEVNVEMTPSIKSPSTAVDIKISAKDAVEMRWAFNDSAAVDEQLKAQNDNAASVAKFNGIMFTADELSQALNGTLTFTREDLWPEAEYKVIVYAVTAEKTETVEVVTVNTEMAPTPARVESSLFESLQGEWYLSYSYIDVQGNSQTMSGKVVNICQGVDDKTEADYRAQNRLVITGWQFQKEDIPFMSPDVLMESHWSWRDQYETLAYRDYGPKVFLEIGAGDVITMPTAKNTCLYHWDMYGNLLDFYGADRQKMQTAPAPFPVELSADGNTLTIKPYVSGAEFSFGTYYPAVFRGSECWSVATSNITLTRK